MSEKRGNHVFIFLKTNLNRAALGIIQRIFYESHYEPGDIHYVTLDATLDEYIAHRDAYQGDGRLVDFFMVFEGHVSIEGETCFRVVYDPSSYQEEPGRIQFVSSEEGLERIAFAGIVGNRTPEELLAQAMECTDEILR